MKNDNFVRVRYYTALHILPEQDKRDFDLLDRKDRRIGYSWCIEAVEVKRAREDAKSYYWQKPELANLDMLYRLKVSVTRDRRSFGASQPWRYFATAEEARRSAIKRADAACARYAAIRQDIR